MKMNVVIEIYKRDANGLTWRHRVMADGTRSIELVPEDAEEAGDAR